MYMTATALTSLPLKTLWRNWFNLYRSFEKNWFSM